MFARASRSCCPKCGNAGQEKVKIGNDYENNLVVWKWLDILGVLASTTTYFLAYFDKVPQTYIPLRKN